MNKKSIIEQAHKRDASCVAKLYLNGRRHIGVRDYDLGVISMINFYYSNSGDLVGYYREPLFKDKLDRV